MNRTVTAVLIVVILALFGGGIYGAVTLNHKIDDLTNKLTISKQAAIDTEKKNNLDLETKCSEASAKFYTFTGYDFKANNDYSNHWNKKLKKCFIQINYRSLNDNFLSVNVFDVFENKQYADFTGVLYCSPKNIKCLLSKGTIWLNGQDHPGPTDINLGFNGLGKGKIGTDKTRQEFLDNVRMFMEN